jgi:hypothetical protein
MSKIVDKGEEFAGRPSARDQPSRQPSAHHVLRKDGERGFILLALVLGVEPLRICQFI